MEWTRHDGYVITDDRSRIDIARVHHWLSVESYWAQGISLERFVKSVECSISFSCFTDNDVQVGVTRLVTDGATFGLISDVFVDSAFRGQGLGKFLVDTAVHHPQARGLNRILLATDDAHDLYRRFGFEALSNPRRWMELRPLQP